jgi:hypothetical protein
MTLANPTNEQEKFFRTITIEATPAQIRYFWRLAFSKYPNAPERSRFIEKIKNKYKLWSLDDITKDQISELINNLK